MTDKGAMKLALFALDIVKIHYTQSRHINEAIAALKERLAEHAMQEVQRLGQEIEQERTWVGLTVEEIATCCRESTTTQLSFYNAIEAKLKEKNT